MRSDPVAAHGPRLGFVALGSALLGAHPESFNGPRQVAVVLDGLVSRLLLGAVFRRRSDRQAWGYLAGRHTHRRV